jgi:O-antigen/teichoic acid export membrane protein
MTMGWRPTAPLSRRSGSGPNPAPEFADPAAGTKTANGRAGLGLGRADGWGPAREAPRSLPGTQVAPARLADRAGRAGGGKLAEVARGSTLNLVGAAFSSAATVAITVLVTRMFSRPVSGAFFSATSLFMIVESVATLGAYTGIVYFIARLRLAGAEGRISIILRAAVIPVVVASITGAAILLIFADPLAHLLLGGHLARGVTVPAVASAVRALAVTLPFAALLDTLLGATRGYRDMRPTVVIDKLARSGVQLAAVAVAVAAGSAGLLAPMWAVPYIPAAAVAWLSLRRIRRRKRADLAGRRAIPPELAALETLASPVAIGHTPVPDHYQPRGQHPIRPEEANPATSNGHPEKQAENVDSRVFWRFTAPRSLATTAQIIIQRIDIVLVAIMRGPVEAAIYTAATRFLVAGQLGNLAISSAAQPQFTELFAMGALRGVNVVYRATTAWLVLLTWPMYLLILVNGHQFLTIFGHSYTAGNTVLVILALSMLLGSACGQVDVVLITAGRSSWSLANGLLAMVVNVSMDVALIPRWGITGAAIGWAVAIVVSNLMPLAQLAISMGLSPFGRGPFIACILCAVNFGAIPFAARLLLGHRGVGIASGAAVGTALMAAGLWYFREPLRLSIMPGVSHFARRHSKR